MEGGGEKKREKRRACAFITGQLLRAEAAASRPRAASGLMGGPLNLSLGDCTAT